jgi:hypothetical protein
VFVGNPAPHNYRRGIVMKLIIFGGLIALTPSLLILAWMLWNAEEPTPSKSIKIKSTRKSTFNLPEIAASFSLDYVEEEPQRHPEQ